MQLRTAIGLALASSGVLFSVQPVTAADAVVTAANNPPNFVTIVIDDMGFSDMQPFGSEVPTPHINALADSGIILNNFYASSTSSPSRSMLFTGKDNHAVGLGTMAGLVGEEQLGQLGYPSLEGGNVIGALSLDVPTFPRLLKDSGYHTMMVGKWHMGEEERFYPINRGFSETRALLLPGGDVHFLADAEGNIISSQLTPQRDAEGNVVLDAEGHRQWVIAEHLYIQNGVKVDKFPATGKPLYATDYFTDQAIEMLTNKPADKPFYLNMSYLSTHTPLQAPTEITAKYVETYKKGWDILRQERFERLKASGFLPATATLPPRPEKIPAWDSLDPQVQLLEATRMAVYAAMVENLDSNVGKLIAHLKNSGEYDNTVFFIFSDNGAEVIAPIFSFGGPRMQAILQQFPYSLQNFVTDPKDPNFDAAQFQTLLDNLGGVQSYIDPGEGWANLMSTPFHEYKSTSFEGGIRTAALISYPQSNLRGLKYDCLSSVMDVAPTFLEMGGATYPAEWNDKPLQAMEGVSMAGVLTKGQFFCNPERYLGFEMDGIKGLRKGNWKLSQKFADESWYMFDLSKDPSETNDLAGNSQYASTFAELIDIYYNQYSKQNNVIPISTKRLDFLGAINLADGSDSAAVFTGGDAVDGDLTEYWKQVQATHTSTHDIAAQIRPAPEDVGKPGRFFAYGSYDIKNPDGSNEILHFAFTPNGLEVIANPAEVFPPVYKEAAAGLPLFEFIQIWEGAGLEVAGTITLSFAYQTDEGNTVVSKQPMTIEIAAPASAN